MTCTILIPFLLFSCLSFLCQFVSSSSNLVSLVMRAAQDDPMVNIKAINDPFIPTNYME